MKKTIEISTELYHRLGKIAQAFESEQSVIERLIDFYENEKNSDNITLSNDKVIEKTQCLPITVYRKLEEHYYPSNLKQFKLRLIETKKAWVKLSYEDGTVTVHEWNTLKFSETSDVRGNLKSGLLRHWREKRIVRADIAIAKNDLP
jgi:predicted CopG family antitoxin